MAIKHFGLRIDEVQLKKLRYIAEYEGKSANRYILIMIHKNIREFERKLGPIQIDTEE